jgi:hypothetical protein
MTPMLEIKLSGSLAAVGFVTAVVCAVLYFMRLPIFAETTVSWIFVIGLIAALSRARRLKSILRRASRSAGGEPLRSEHR